MSGAGKSTALRCFEDMGYLCVDNIPPQIIETFLKLLGQSETSPSQVAFVCDIRSGALFDDFHRVWDELSAMGVSPRVIFLDSDNATLVRRYKELRRQHPLTQGGISNEAAIASERERLEPIGDPVFSEVKEEAAGHLTFRMDIEVVPRFELEGYAGVKVDAEPVEVRGEEVEDVLKNLQERQADFVLVDRPAVSGDLVTLDFAPVGLDDEPDGKRLVTEYPAQLGVGHLFPEFEQAITGNPAGFTGRVEITYPEDYGGKELAGRKILYQFTIREVKEKRLPALDDAFAKAVEEKFESLADLRADIEKRLRDEKERETKRKREERAVDTIIERNPFEVPLTMIERYRTELEAEDDRRRQAMGGPSELDEEQLKQRDELFEKVATRNIKRYFVLERIAEREGVEVSDEEMDSELEKIGEESERPIEEVRKYFKKGSDQYAKLKNSLREQKIFEIILGTPQGG